MSDALLQAVARQRNAALDAAAMAEAAAGQLAAQLTEQQKRADALQARIDELTGVTPCTDSSAS